MNYLFSIIAARIKHALENESVVGVTVILDKLQSPQAFVDTMAKMFGSKEGYLVLDGVDVHQLKCPNNLHLSGTVEKAVEWRNFKSAQGHIVYCCAQLRKRSHSLNDFYKLTPRRIVSAIAQDQSDSAKNRPLARFWSALAQAETDSFSLAKLLDFLNALNEQQTGLEKEIWRLGLIPDKQILNPTVNVEERIQRNLDIIEQLNFMDDGIRRRMAASLANFDRQEKRTYRLLLDYFNHGDFQVFKDLDVDRVFALISKTKTHADLPSPTTSQGETIVPIKPQNPTKTLLDEFVKGLSGDKTVQDKIKDFGSALIDYTKKHDAFDENDSDDKPTIEDPKTETSLVFPPAKLDRNLFKLVTQSATPENWGGVVLSKQANLHDAIADADSICADSEMFKPFRPCFDEPNPFFTKSRSLKTELALFDEALEKRGRHSNLVPLFDKITTARKETMCYLDALLRYGHLAVFGCNAEALDSINRYIGAWKDLYDEFKRVEEDMHEISDSEYQHAARCLISLDVLFLRIKDEWKAIMMPTNPLFLWIYSEIYGQLKREEYNFSEVEYRHPLVKALKDLPNLINFQLVPREIFAVADLGANEDYILPCSGSQGILPTFENKTNRYLGSDGMECIGDTIKRYLAFAPYAGNDLRISVVDVPDVMECVRIVAKCISETMTRDNKSTAATLEIFLTDCHSGGRDMDNLDFAQQDSDVSDLIQSDNLRIKVIHCKNLAAVAAALKSDPVHLAFYFDQSTYQVSYGATTRELYITPLVVTYDFNYNAVSSEGEIFPNTDTNNGFLGSYYAVFAQTGSAHSQTRVPRTSYLKTQELEYMLGVLDNRYTQWLIAADRIVYNYVPKEGLPIGVKNFGRRNVCIWANKNSRVIQQFVMLLKQYNLHPTREALVDVFNRFGHISGEGLVGIPAKKPGGSETANARRKGMLGTVFAAKWYADQHPNALVASLDSDEGRTWLSTTEDEATDNKRADLVGFRLDSESNGIIVDVLEVKTRSAKQPDFTFSTENGRRIIQGHAADQVGHVLDRLQQVFQFDLNECENMFVAARRETLKYQIVNECFRSKYLPSQQIEEWSKRLKLVFSGGCPIKICGTIVHVDLENSSSDVPDARGFYESASNEYELGVVSLTARSIQHEIFGGVCEGNNTVIATNQQLSIPIENKSPSVESEEQPPSEDSSSGAQPAIPFTFSDDTFQTDDSPELSEEENVPEIVKAFRLACNSFSIRIEECDAESARIGPSVIRFFITLKKGQKIESLRKALPDIGRQIAHTKLRIQQVENTNKIAVDVMRKHRKDVPFDDVISLLPPIDGLEQMPILIGQTPEGENVLRYFDQMPHLLVGGTTGSGKTVFLSTLLLSLLSRHPKKEQLQLLITSSKVEDFIAFESIPHLISNGIVAQATDAINYIKQQVFQESERRQKLFVAERVSKISLYNQHMREKGLPQLPPVVVLVDEFADLADNISDRNDRDAFFRTLRQIAQAGRSRGIHLILCTQRPSAKLLDTNIKAQLPGRVALTVADIGSSKMILDIQDAGAERLQGRGDLLFRDPGGALIRAQGFSLDLDSLPTYVEHALG